MYEKETRLSLKKSKILLTKSFVSIGIYEYLYFIVFGLQLIIFLFDNTVHTLLDIMLSFTFLFVFSFILIHLFMKKINKNIILEHPFISGKRTLNQISSLTKRVQAPRKLYKNFIEAVEKILDGKVKILFIIPIKRVQFKTHTIILEHMLTKNFKIPKEQVKELLTEDKKEREKVFIYKNKEVKLVCKYLAKKVLIEECLIKKRPYKYLEDNYEHLIVSNYLVKVAIDQ